MGIEAYKKDVAQRKAFINAIAQAEARMTPVAKGKYEETLIVGLQETDRASKVRIDKTHVEVSISGRGVSSSFIVDNETNMVTSHSFSSIDDKQEELDVAIHVARLQLMHKTTAPAEPFLARQDWSEEDFR